MRNTKIIYYLTVDAMVDWWKVDILYKISLKNKTSTQTTRLCLLLRVFGSRQLKPINMLLCPTRKKSPLRLISLGETGWISSGNVAGLASPLRQERSTGGVLLEPQISPLPAYTVLSDK